MKQKIEYFLNAVFYINWKWLVKRQIYPIKAISYIRIKISSFLTTKKYHEKVIGRQRKNILEMGASEDSMKLFVKFRGCEPNTSAFLKHYGFTD